VSVGVLSTLATDMEVLCRSSASRT
jgi:hypothetical protein